MLKVGNTGNVKQFFKHIHNLNMAWNKSVGKRGYYLARLCWEWSTRDTYR